jgi:hypothetical protein
MAGMSATLCGESVYAERRDDGRFLVRLDSQSHAIGCPLWNAVHASFATKTRLPFSFADEDLQAWAADITPAPLHLFAVDKPQMAWNVTLESA